MCVVLLGEDKVACGLEGVTFAFEFVMLVFEGAFEATFCDGLFKEGVGGGFECVGDGGGGIFEERIVDSIEVLANMVGWELEFFLRLILL